MLHWKKRQLNTRATLLIVEEQKPVTKKSELVDLSYNQMRVRIGAYPLAPGR